MKNLVQITLLLVTVFSPAALNYKILGLLPYNGRSHFIMFEPLFKALAEKGHEVDVVSHFPQKEKLPRYNDLSIKGILPDIVGKLSFDKMGKLSFIKELYTLVTEFGLKNCEKAFNTTVLQDLKNGNRKYDLIFTEIFSTDCMYGFAYHFDVPVVAISTNTDLPWGASRIGNPVNPSYIPTYFLSSGKKMNLYERVSNTIIYLTSLSIYRWYAQDENTKVARKFFGEDMPHINDLIYSKTNMIFINTHPSINYVAPKVPNFIEIAGIHIYPPKPLPKKIEHEMNISSNYKGVIYVSFGSLIAVETLPPYVLRIFCDVFSTLPYKIMWKGPLEKFPKNLSIPPNVHLEKWMPQRDMLCHPNVKLFISHGGLMGTQESIYCGVPMLGLPIFADQELNIANSENRGVALKLRFDNITTETFSKSVQRLLEDKSFKENAMKLSDLFRERPMSALDTAVYWTEYVLKYKGAPHLKSVAADMPWYELLLVDVIAILAIIFAFILFTLYFIFKTMFKLFNTHNNVKLKVK